jgi:hypothetical protein
MEIVLERSEVVLDAGEIEQVDLVAALLERGRNLENAERDKHTLIKQKRRWRSD